LLKSLPTEDIELIEKALNRMNKVEISDDNKTESDTDFHLAIARASHNFVFVNIMKLHLDLLKETRERTQKILGRQEKQRQEHQAIFQAIKKHDCKKAGESMLKHLRNVKEAIIKV